MVWTTSAFTEALRSGSPHPQGDGMNKTGTEVLGTRLFADGRAIEKTLKRLPAEIRKRLPQLRREWPEAEAEQLRDRLHAEFAIESLVIGEVRAIKIETSTRNFLNEYRCWMSGHLHEAEVPFTGHPMYWRAPLTILPSFSYYGKIGLTTMRLRIFIDVEDYYDFRNSVEKELHHARQILAHNEIVYQTYSKKARDMVDQAWESSTR
jgi:hypothetical protein